MKYKKAQDILPKELIEELQKYAEGVYVYIPTTENNKKSWGFNTTIKKDLAERNENIYNDFKNGVTIRELAKKYYLVENSIRRILREYK